MLKRLIIVASILAVALFSLIARLTYLSIFHRDFLIQESQARILRKVAIPVYRGMITDRLGDPLAISAPVISVWINPKIFQIGSAQLTQLSQLLDLHPHFIDQLIKKNRNKEFIYLKRRIPPQTALSIKNLKISGLFFQREFKRFYPEGEIAAQVIGLTNVDDQGQEGLELAYDQWLRGVPGIKEVLKDRLGYIVANVGMVKKPIPGHDLTLSLDHRIQYLAYWALKEAMQKYQAASGSIIILNPKTGEILAVANQPTFNPNQLSPGESGAVRNRALTDTFEPGSVIKPFNIALALESGKYTINSKINTSPGWMLISGYKIEDDQGDNGVLNLEQVLEKSSNIGAAKIMLSLRPQEYWDLLQRMGFGERTNSAFPGESSGSIVEHTIWYPSVIATLAYGYGIAVTDMQLAQAYSILADQGVKIPLTFLKLDQAPSGTQMLNPEIAKQVLSMLEGVVKEGTGTRAQVYGYRVAGKTGTAYIAQGHGYDKHNYSSSFVGIAPVSDPQLVMVVTIHQPKGLHFGAEVAAPVFSQVMTNALRILNIPPDNLPEGKG